MAKEREAKLRKMDFWTLHHEHPAMMVTKDMYDHVCDLMGLLICWEGITEIHGNNPTIFGVMRTITDDLRLEFLLECTLYYERHHENECIETAEPEVLLTASGPMIMA